MRIVDTLANLVSGLFTAKDKSLFDRFVFQPMQRAEIEAAYRGDWIARKIVDVPAFDMTRAWRDWQAGPEAIEAIEAEERRLDLRGKVTRALRLARLYGGAAIYMGDGGSDPAQELRLDAIGKGGLRYLHVLSRWQVTAGDIDRDPLSPFCGEPGWYLLNSPKAGALRIHPSRVIRLVGADVPDGEHEPGGWGDSVLDAVRGAVAHAGLTAASIASLVHEAKVDVIKVPNMMASLTTKEYTDRLGKRFAYANVAKSLHNMLLLDAEEEWDPKQISFAGLTDVLRLYLEIAAGAADIPATRLIGQSPRGLSATGESDIRNYYDRIAGDQDVLLRPLFNRLDEALIRSSLGSRDPAIHYRFAPLWQLSDKEKADMHKTKAQTTKIYADSGLMPQPALALAVHNQLVEDGVYPGLDMALKGETKAAPAEIIDRWLENRALAKQLETRDYAPGQPHVPAGQPGAGQFAGNNGRVQVAGGYAGKEGMTVQGFISAYCNASIMEVMPSEFLPMTIGEVEVLADAGSSKARRCLKLLSRNRFRK